MGTRHLPRAKKEMYQRKRHWQQQIVGLPVSHGPGEGEVVFVILHGPDIVTQVEVGIPQLTVDRTQGPETEQLLNVCTNYTKKPRCSRTEGVYFFWLTY